MALVVKMDVAFNPVDVGFLGANAVVLEADAIADASEEARRFRSVHRDDGI